MERLKSPGRANLAAMERVPTNPDGNLPNAEAVLDPEAVLSPFKVDEWRRLSPSERLDRACALRKLLISPRDAHDRKIFPAP